MQSKLGYKANGMLFVSEKMHDAEPHSFTGVLTSIRTAFEANSSPDAFVTRET